MTNQYDVKTIYKRKSMPYRKKKRWIRTIRTNRALQMKSLATRSVVRNSTIIADYNPGLEDAQAFSVAALYGYNGTDVLNNEVGMSDIQNITQNDGDINDQADKFVFASACLDLTFNNVGTNKLEVDVYTVYCNGRQHGANFSGDQSYVNANTPTIGGGASLELNDRGATPFSFPGMSSLGHRVMKKVKHFVGAGEVFTHQVRDPRNVWINNYELQRFTPGTVFAKKGLTKYLLFIVKRVPGSEGNIQYRIGCTRSYSYKVLKENKTQDVNL